MTYFKTMHRIIFRLELRPRPAMGRYRGPPAPLARYKGATSKEVKERREEEKKGCKGGKLGLPSYY